GARPAQFLQPAVGALQPHVPCLHGRRRHRHGAHRRLLPLDAAAGEPRQGPPPVGGEEARRCPATRDAGLGPAAPAHPRPRPVPPPDLRRDHALGHRAHQAARGLRRPMQIDYAAVAPELVLTGALCGVLVFGLVLPEDRQGLIMPVSLLGVAGTLLALLALAGGPVRTTLGGMFVVDSFAVTLKILFCVAALLTLAMSYDYLRRDEIHQGEF